MSYIQFCPENSTSDNMQVLFFLALAVFKVLAGIGGNTLFEPGFTQILAPNWRQRKNHLQNEL